jgi:hypothetical protein
MEWTNVSQIEREQTIQWPKEKGKKTKDGPQLIKHDIEIADEQIIIKGFVSGFFVFKS